MKYFIDTLSRISVLRKVIKMRKRLVALGASAIIGASASGILMGSLAQTASAQSQVGCYAASCNGKDPHDMGCDADAKTIDTVYTGGGGGTILLRWSGTCQANWATANDVPSWGSHFWVENKARNKQSNGWGWLGAASGWTDMVNGHQILARACDDAACTGWH